MKRYESSVIDGVSPLSAVINGDNEDGGMSVGLISSDDDDDDDPLHLLELQREADEAEAELKQAEEEAAKLEKELSELEAAIAAEEETVSASDAISMTNSSISNNVEKDNLNTIQPEQILEEAKPTSTSEDEEDSPKNNDDDGDKSDSVNNEATENDGNKATERAETKEEMPADDAAAVSTSDGNANMDDAKEEESAPVQHEDIEVAARDEEKATEQEENEDEIPAADAATYASDDDAKIDDEKAADSEPVDEQQTAAKDEEETNIDQDQCSEEEEISTAAEEDQEAESIKEEVEDDETDVQSPPSKEQSTDEESFNQASHYDAVIVGGGPAGLLSAIMMAQQLPHLDTPTNIDDGQQSPSQTTNSPRIIVYDRLPPPPPPDALVYSTDSSKYYLLGLGHRGQSALRHFGVWDDVEKASTAVLGRRDWSPGKTKEEEGNIKMADKAVTSRVLPRDKLVGVLKKVIEERYGGVVELRYGYQVDPISFGNEENVEKEGEVDEKSGSGPPVTLQVSRCIPINSPLGDGEECSIDNALTTITTNFLIGSDGAARTIANAMENNNDEKHQKSQLPFHVKRYKDDNPRVYKSVPISLPAHWPHDLNYSARSTNSRVNFEALPSDTHGNYCALMLMKPDDPLASVDCDPILLRQFFDEEFPQFGKLLEDGVIADVAKKGASSLPSFRYAGPRLHEGGRTVLLGDCVHTVKPYFGLGANTALEDVQILSKILSNTPNLSQNLHNALPEFTKQRAADSRALVTISRGIDRPGKLGTLRFILPLILDSMFHKVAPKIFGPSIFGMFQQQGIGFRQIQRRKRLDRAMQSIVVLSGMSLAAVGLRCLVKSVARVLGVKDIAVSGCLIALLGAVGIARRIAKAGEA